MNSNIPFNIRIADPHLSEEARSCLHQEIDGVLSGLLSSGPQVTPFEQEFARIV